MAFFFMNSKNDKLFCYRRYANLIKIIYKFLIFFSAFLLLFAFLKSGDLFSGASPNRKNVSNYYSMLYSAHPNSLVELIEEIKDSEDISARYMWFPLNTAYYIFIPDKHSPQRIYLGTSFLNEYTGHRDYPGLLNLTNPTLIGEGIARLNPNELCRSIKLNNINYIILNKYILTTDLGQKALDYFSFNGSNQFMQAQLSNEIKSEIFGQEISSLNGGFEIYKVNENLHSNKISVYSGQYSPKDNEEINWCKENPKNLLKTNFVINNIENSLSFSATLDGKESYTISLIEDMGFRYSLTLDEIPKDITYKIRHMQIGPQYLSTVTFDKPYEGLLKGSFKKTNFFEKNFILLIASQAIVITLVLTITLLAALFKCRKI